MLLRTKCILIKSEFIFDSFVKIQLETEMVIGLKVRIEYQMNKLLANQKFHLICNNKMAFCD